MLEANLIIEGIDRVGKSTLVEQLTEYEHIKMTAPVSLARTFYEYLVYFCKINGTMKQLDRPIVFDRGHISELVYGNLYRPTHYSDGVLLYWILQMEAKLVHAIERSAYLRPTYIVYVEPSNFSIMLDDERPNANRYRELALYEQALRRTKLPVIRVTTQTAEWKNPSSVITEIKEQLHG